MRLKTFKIKNFRGYNDEVSITMDDLTVFVGKNDIGKSTVLEAMEIFFNEAKGIIKFEKEDVNKTALASGDDETVFTAIFENLPPSIVIDASNPTILSEEYLLNTYGDLEVVKKYSNAGKEKVFIKANHPTKAECKDLFSSKPADLRKILDNENIECENRTKNAVMRAAIWSHFAEELELSETLLDVTKGDTKTIWDKLKTKLPLYSLFQSDRKNSDGDSEVQDPLKEAVKQILSNPDLENKLKDVSKKVKEELDKVASKTLDKLREMNQEIADSLDPKIPDHSALKWNDVFKNVSISGDDDIPINKRGSGVKRLVLINFFRAEAERRREQADIPSIIYAIEEPETSQHYEHQRQLIDALLELSNTDDTQIFLTSHSSTIVKSLQFGDLRLISRDNGQKQISNIEPTCLSYPSLNEVNFSAFGEITEEYHNELYEHLKNEHAADKGIKGFDQIFFQGILGESKSSPWMSNPNEVSIHTFIRNQIHHRAENGAPDPSELKNSITVMRNHILDSN